MATATTRRAGFDGTTITSSPVTGPARPTRKRAVRYNVVRRPVATRRP
jgi:hypothetical protein